MLRFLKKSYRFIIRDMVEHYDECGEQDDRDWWEELGLECVVEDENKWTNSWDSLRREGWLDLFEISIIFNLL